MLNFEKLSVYQKAIDFSIEIYTITCSWPKSDLFGLTSQIQRSALSISLNIAEGSARTKKENRHFLDIAKGSCYECIPLLTIAKKRNLITSQKHVTLYTQLIELTKMISGLKRSLT